MTEKPLKLATWNINSVRLRIELAKKLLVDEDLDVLCLQEIKCVNDAFPLKEFHKAGYEHVAINGQKGYHGVAIASRIPFKRVDMRGFCEKGDARHLSVDLVGDLNIAPLEHDVWSHKQLLKIVSHTPVEVDLMNELFASHDWIDVMRQFVPPIEKLYSWWSYRAKDWEAADRGRRLDHVWVTPALKAAPKAMKVLKEARGWERASDHVPVIVSLAL